VEEITSALLAVDDQELIDEITTRLRALRLSGPVSVDGGGDGSWKSSSRTSMISPGGRNAAPGGRPPITAAAVMLGLYECRADTEGDMLLLRTGLPGAADDLARMVFEKVRPLHLSLPPRADECPEWTWYEETWRPCAIRAPRGVASEDLRTI
jgi:hypothetical protein